MKVLEAKNVCKYFSGLKAVDMVDLIVEEKEILGIIGPNGAGKTTFFNLCAGTYPVTSGEIWFLGKNITNKKQDQVAELGMARTFQNIKLFTEMTVKENIAVGFHISTRSNIIHAIFHTKRYHQDENLIQVETEKILHDLKLAQYSDLKASNLSYGLQRKVEIARAMALKPKLLLLDEPAAGLNPAETEDLSVFIKELNQIGYTIIVIEHDMKFIMNLCHRIVVLNYGKKICEGTPNEVKNNVLVQEAYFGKGLAAGEAIKRQEEKTC